MQLSRVAYAFVDAGGAVPAPQITTVSPDIADYLEDHRADVVERASTGRVAEAVFTNPTATARFSALAHGSDADFTNAATSLAQRLHARMDGRTAKGFFVAATFRHQNQVEAMVLKLDATDRKLAAIGGTAHSPTLESVEDLLDVPGELQKGAVYPDPRPYSEVCVGDKNRETSLYYLDAIEVVQRELPGRAVASLLHVANEVDPQHTEALTRHLETVTGRTPVSSILAGVTPPIPAPTRSQIESRLANKRRPVTDADPTDHATMGIVSADGIVIRGAAARIRDGVRWRPNPTSTGYIIEIEVAQQPSRSFE